VEADNRRFEFNKNPQQLVVFSEATVNDIERGRGFSIEPLECRSECRQPRGLTLKGRCVRERISSIILRAPAASVAPTLIEPSAPASETAAASAGVETPAMGAWMIGKSTPR
jgi:hypothetical protein